MSELRNLLHEQADAARFTPPDLDAITRTGEARVRRRRAATGLAGLATAAVVGGVAVLLPGTDGSGGPEVAGDSAAGRPVSWATGSVLHLEGGESVDVGHEVAAYVRTSAGYLVADPGGTVWSVVGDRVEQVGRTSRDALRLAADEDGTRAAWLDVRRREVVVVDHAAPDAEPVRVPVEPSEKAYVPYLDTVDGATVHVSDSRGTVSIDLGTGAVTPVQRLGAGSGVADAEDGLLAVVDERGVTFGAAAGWETEGELLRVGFGDLGILSDDGRWYSQEGDEPRVHDTRGGARVDLDLDHEFATGYEWLGDSTLAVLAQRDADDPVELLRCTVPSGRCTHVVDLDLAFDDPGGFALPVGAALGG